MARVIGEIAESVQAPVDTGLVSPLLTDTHYGYAVRAFDPPDPFLMFQDVSGDCPGVPKHPHAGIETVTYIQDGAFLHRNSAGGRGTVGPGGVQAMVAGRGIVHAEDQLAGPARAFQLWLKLPDAEERCEPRYQVDVAHEDGGLLDVTAGVEMVSPVLYVHLQRSRTVNCGNAQAFAYVSRGTAVISGMHAEAGQAVVLKIGTLVNVQMEDGEVLVIAAMPHGESVARHAGFASSSKSGIMRAYHGYLTGRFGVLKE